MSNQPTLTSLVSHHGLGPRDLVAASVVYAALTILLTYPLAFAPASLSRLDSADGRVNAWAISWVAHQLVNNPLQLFEANILHPLPHTLAFSEHLLVPGLIALPLLRASDDLVLTFNLVLLLSVFASALGMYVLMVSLTGSHLAALLAGLFFSFASYRFVRLPQIQMQLYAFMPLALACLHRFFSSGCKRWAYAFSGFFVLQALSGTYLAAMTAVASGVALVTLAPGSPCNRRQLATLALAISLAAAAIYPFARPYLWVNRTLGTEWDTSQIAGLSATPSSYLASPSRLYRGAFENFLGAEDPHDLLFPGLTLLLLGGMGAWLLIANGGGFYRPRTTAICYLGIMVIGLVISLGPGTPVHSVLYERVLFFRGLRILSRFGLLPLLSLSVLSGYALTWIFREIRTPARRWWTALAVAVLFVGESTLIPLPLKPYRDRPAEFHEWLVSEGKPGPIVELPFRRIDSHYMFSARHHEFRPTLNGDSSFIPPSHVWMKSIFLRFPSPDSIALLRALEVRYVVVHLGAYRHNDRRLRRLLDGLDLHRKEFQSVGDFGRDLVLEVLAGKSTPRPVLPAESIEVRGRPLSLFDSRIETVWQGGSRRALIEMRLAGVRTVSGLRLHYGRNPRMPVNDVAVEILDPLGRWHPHWSSPREWPAVAEMVLSLLEDPTDGKQTLRFAPIQTRTLRLKLGGYRGRPEIADIELMGPPKSYR